MNQPELLHHLLERPYQSAPTDNLDFNHLYLTDELNLVTRPTQLADCHHPTVARLLSGIFTRKDDITWKP